MRISCSQWRFSLSPIYERKTWKNLNIEKQNFISIFVFRYSPPWRFCAQICTIANVLIANIMFAVEVLTFTHLRKKNLEKFEYRNTEFYFDFRFSIFAPWRFCAQICTIANVLIANIMFAVEVLTFTHLRKKTWKNLNIEIQNFISIFVFRYSPPWRFCAQICTIVNVLIANIMFALKVLTFAHLRKKNLAKFEYRNTEFYFDFRFSIFAPLAFFFAQICTIANVLIANIMFAVEVLTFTHLRKKNLEKFEYRNTEFYFDFRFSIFAPLAFLCSNLYFSERAHCEYHVRIEGSHIHPSTKEKLSKI